MANKKRTWGYEIMIETNSDFREEFIRNCFEQMMKGLKIYNETTKKGTKIVWRELQPDEVEEL